MFGKLAGYKTYITGSLTIVGCVAAYLTGAQTLQQSLELGVPALLAMCLRHGVDTVVTNAIVAGNPPSK